MEMYVHKYTVGVKLIHNYGNDFRNKDLQLEGRERRRILYWN